MCRQWRRVRAGDERHPGLLQQRLEGARVAAPQDGDQWAAAVNQGFDGGLGHRFPALAAVRGRFARLDGEAAVQQQHALFEPASQIPVRTRLDAQVGCQLAVDVDQTLR